VSGDAADRDGMSAETPAEKGRDEGGWTVGVLGSGSRGNAVYVSDGTTSILVDAGFSAREIERRMRSLGLEPGRLDAVLVTHEHTDHVRGIARLARRHRLPVYLTAGTRAGAPSLQELPELPTFSCGREFRIGSLAVRPFSIAHDARDPAGFTIGADGLRIGIATDLGHATALVKEHLRGCRLLILEANHDPQLLLDGPYPWYLKQRIRGRNGHLSNRASGEVLAEIRHAGLEHVILAHLSETNNRPEIALAETARALEGARTRLSAAAQDRCLPVIRLG
jgi:phosphoribosyl 1,2-cyclic phosphodiesterase